LCIAIPVFTMMIAQELAAQTPGLIVKPATGGGASVLDPDGDGYVSQKTNGIQLGFTIPPDNDVMQSEIPYVALVRPDVEGDLLRGPTGGFTEIVGVDAAGNNAILTYANATNLLYRFRIDGYAPNSKSYSILIDTDGKMGFTGTNADPNAVTGNPGFEVEIVLETNFNVKAYNVDGTTSGTEVANYSYDTNCQKSVAVSTAGGNPDYFYDFYLPFSSLSTLFSSSTPLRYVGITSMNPHPAIGNNATSDVGGAGAVTNLDQTFIDLVNAQTPSVPGAEVLDRSACPSIDAVAVGNTTITGASTEASGTTINVYVYQSNGTTLIGSGTTTTSGSGWSINVSLLNPSVTLAGGYLVKATATASGKGVSFDNCDIETVTSCSVQTNIPTSSEITKISGSKGYDVTISRPIGTKVYLYTSNYSVRSVADLKNAVTNPFTTTTNPQTFSFECQTGNCFGSDVYYFRFEEPGKCISPYYVSCDYATGGTSNAPTISTSPINTSTTSISGNGTSASSQILIYADGNQIAATTSASSSPYAWTATVSSLSLCQVITAKQIVSGQCLSSASSGVTVTRAAIAPSISSAGCSVTPPTSVSGLSSEIGSTVQLVKTSNLSTPIGSTTVTTAGTWTVSSISPALASGDVIEAKIAAGGCVTASGYSNQVSISTQTNISAYTIGFTTPTEGQTSATGTISGGTYPVTLKVYVDETLVGSGIVVSGAGNWTVSGLNSFDLAVGSKVQATLTGTGCESALSSSYATVQCLTPADKTVSSGATTVCANSYGTVTVQSSEAGIIYTPVASDGTTVFGYGALGTGSNLNLQTYQLTTNPTVVKVKASKFPIGSCDYTLSGSVSFTVDALPSAPTASSPQIYCGSGSTTLADLSVTVSSGGTLKWYAASSGGSSIASTTSLVNGTTYYAESENATTGCVSATRTAILVQTGTLPAPNASASQTFCSGATVANLAATLSGPGTINWFSAPTGGTALSSGTTLVTQTYYAETAQNSCVSASRTAGFCNRCRCPNAHLHF